MKSKRRETSERCDDPSDSTKGDEDAKVPEWHDQAECRDMNWELWFPLARTGSDRRKKETAEAKRICKPCPVRAECLDHALRFGEFGIWGGLDEDERRAIRRRNAEAAASVPPPRVRRSSRPMTLNRL